MFVPSGSPIKRNGSSAAPPIAPSSSGTRFTPWLWNASVRWPSTYAAAVSPRTTSSSWPGFPAGWSGFGDSLWPAAGKTTWSPAYSAWRLDAVWKSADRRCNFWMMQMPRKSLSVRSRRKWCTNRWLQKVIYVWQSINQSIHPSIHPSINQSNNPSINQSINQSIGCSINQSIDQSIDHLNGR